MAISGIVSVKKTGSSARRCLFGPPDHQRIRKDLDRALSEMDRSTKSALKSKWGFDMDSETGVPEGRYEYSEVRQSEYIPEFYRKGYTTRTKRVTRKDSVKMVSAGTQMDSSASVSSSTQAGQGLDSHPAAVRITVGVRKLDFKENCVRSPSSPSSTSTSSLRSSPVQSTMTDFFQRRKRRSPDYDTSYSRGKSPRL